MIGYALAAALFGLLYYWVDRRAVGYWRQALIYIISVFLFISVYYALYALAYTLALVNVPIQTNGLGFLYREGLVIAVVSLPFYLLQSQHSARMLLTLLPAVGAYLLFDWYGNVMGGQPSLLLLTQLPLLFQFLSWWQLTLCIVCLACFFLPMICAAGGYWALLRCVASVVVMILFAWVAASHPKETSRLLQTKKNHLAYQGYEGQLLDNGRFYWLIYHAANQLVLRQRLKDYRSLDRGAYWQMSKLRPHIRPHHVYVHILESFVDPDEMQTLVQQVKKREKDFHGFSSAAYRSQVAAGKSMVISHIFGGESARTHFEILCGLPSLGWYDGLDYTLFTGAKTACLPSILRDAQPYHTVVSESIDANFFNEYYAHQSIGFQVRLYRHQAFGSIAGEPVVPLDINPHTAVKDHIYEGDQFREYYQRIRPYMHDKTGLFSLVNTMTGHFPFDRNRQARPDVFHLPLGNDSLERVINIYHYRTQALVKTLAMIEAEDPKSLVIFVSDHNVVGINYQKEGYWQRLIDFSQYPKLDRRFIVTALVVENGQFRVYRLIQMTDLFLIILNYVSDGYYCRQHRCGFLHPGFVNTQTAMHPSAQQVEAYLRVTGSASRTLSTFSSANTAKKTA